MLVYKKRGEKFDQNSYDSLFKSIENNLRELGHGDVSVNKKMKDLNKQLYDILLKIDENNNESLKINKKLIFKYFNHLENEKGVKYNDFERYFLNFYKVCFELPLKNMIREAINFK